MEYGKKVSHSYMQFLIDVFSREIQLEICICITNNMIAESQLLGGIELNERNLDFMLGDSNVKLMWCKTFYLHKDMMKNGIALSSMQKLMKSKKSCL